MWMQGVQEITLLGQNVNSYRGGGSEFAELLRRVDALGVPRIRFMTSHPKDLERRVDRRLWRACAPDARPASARAGWQRRDPAGDEPPLYARALSGACQQTSVCKTGRRSDQRHHRRLSRRNARRSLKTRSRSCAKCATIPPSPSSIPSARARRAAQMPDPTPRGGKDGAHTAPDRPANRDHPRDPCIAGGQGGKRCWSNPSPRATRAGSAARRRAGTWSISRETPISSADLSGWKYVSAGRNTLRGRQITEV